MLGFDGFEWDEGNSDKCEKHGVLLDEIEKVLQGKVHVFPDLKHSHHERRYLAIGQTAAGRYLFLAFADQAAGPETADTPHQRSLHARQGGRAL